MNNAGQFPLDFATPWALWLLLLLPIWWVLRARRRPPAITFSRLDVIAQGPQSGNWYPKVIFALRNLLLFFLILALARPRLAVPSQEERDEGINIALLIDVSGSMLSQDFEPRDRLEVAKATMRDFIMGRHNDRIGLMAFANEAYTVTPLTTAYPILVQDVNNLQVGQLDDGTAIGDAIIAGTQRLVQAPGKSKVMILLTDGVNNRGRFDPLTGAKVANTYGVKIYTIGVGKQGTAPVPVVGRDGTRQLEMRPVEIDERLLTQVAQMTGGQFFRAVDAAALGRVYRQINSLEGSTIESTVPAHHADVFRWPLGAMIVLLLLELGISAVRAPLP
jgi:Ca-activated chloride channel family protein